MERSYTNRALSWRGDTTSVTVRLPNPVVEFIDTHLDKTIRNRSEFLQHWAEYGRRVAEFGIVEVAEFDAASEIMSHGRHVRREDQGSGVRVPPGPQEPGPVPEREGAGLQSPTAGFDSPPALTVSESSPELQAEQVVAETLEAVAEESVDALEARVVPTFPVEEPAIMEGTTVVPTTPRTGDPQLDEIYGGMLEGFRNRIR